MIDACLESLRTRLTALHESSDGTVRTYLQHTLDAIHKFSVLLEDARARGRTDNREIVHDLRSPLNAMIGFTSMLLTDDHDLTADQREEIGALNALARQLNHEVDAQYPKSPE